MNPRTAPRRVLDRITSSLVSNRVSRRAIEQELRDSPDFAAWLANEPAVREELMNSEPFRAAIQVRTRFGAPDPAIPIDVDVTDRQLAAAFDRVRATWEQVGTNEPYWSVISADRFLSDQLDDTEEFYASGEDHARDLRSILARHDVDTDSIATCLEFGCGVGRVTRWLARDYDQVVACDISRPHLDLTEARIAQDGLDNVETRLVTGPEALASLPPSDLVYSIMVLQHNPPPIMAFIVARLLDAVAPGGHAAFQLPTYDRRYRFSIEEYLDGGEVDGILMHVLPQRSVFDAVDAAGCRVVEVYADHLAGMAPRTLSNMFVVRRPA